jgi:hypothetical protein
MGFQEIEKAGFFLPGKMYSLRKMSWWTSKK